MIRACIETNPLSGFGRLESEPARSEMRNGFREEQSDRKIELTITYMMEHLNQSLPVAKLAALANMSPSHYTALFKRRTGCAPIDFFIRLRMQHARELLMGTSLNVKEVAAALGYEDPFYFSRVFKSVNQLAPSDYRTRQRAAGSSGAHAPAELHANHTS
jgi:transcriptional regulator GlxA family with amidase domain